MRGGTTTSLQYPHAALGGQPLSAVTAFALVFGAVSFNLVLCFVNTSVTGVGELHVVASEALILSLVLLVSYRAIEQPHLILIGFTILWTLSLAAIRYAAGTESGIDVKIARDLIIPIAFFLLGARTRDLKAADRIVAFTVAAILAVALFEYFFLELFTRFFNVAKYYIARGTLEARQIFQESELFISGMRPAGLEGGRNLLPFLGDHRVSSVFLEPVSLGNFGVIAFMWGLIRSRFEHTLYFGVMLGALALIVLGDSRFGAYLCAAMVVLVMLPVAWTTVGAIVLPVVALAVLTFVPLIVTGSYDPQNRYIDNGFVGRFVLSARLLGDFDLLTWFGLAAPRAQSFDSGYAYIIGRIGVIGLAIFWLLPFAMKSPSLQFSSFRNAVAFYFGTILCVSNSPFTIKTASLLWFFVGVLAVSGRPQAAHAVVSPRRDDSGFGSRLRAGHPTRS